MITWKCELNALAATPSSIPNDTLVRSIPKDFRGSRADLDPLWVPVMGDRSRRRCTVLPGVRVRKDNAIRNLTHWLTRVVVGLIKYLKTASLRRAYNYSYRG